MLMSFSLKFSSRSNVYSVIREGIILSFAALISSLTAASPRIIIEELYGLEKLATIGAALYVCGILSNILAPFQNKLRSEIINAFRQPNEKVFKTILKEHGKLFILLLSILIPILIYFKEINSLLFDQQLLDDKLIFSIIYLSFILYSMLSLIDVYLQIIRKFNFTIVVRIISLFSLTSLLFILSFLMFDAEFSLSIAFLTSTILVAFLFYKSRLWNLQ